MKKFEIGIFYHLDKKNTFSLACLVNQIKKKIFNIKKFENMNV